MVKRGNTMTPLQNSRVTVDSADSARCENCDAHVSRPFVRVFGDNEGTLHRCLECTTFRELQDGAGSHSHSHA